MPIQSKYRKEHVVPIEYNQLENFESLCTNDRLVLILILNGSLSLNIDQEFVICTAPGILCINNKNKISIINNNKLRAKSISFSPTYINTKMTFEEIYNENYSEIADQHDYLLLRPFLNRTEDYIGFISLGNDYFESLAEYFDKYGNELTIQRDVFWSCRTRSHLMKIILLLEEIYEEHINSKRALYNLQFADGYVAQVVEYIHLNYSKNITIPQLCELVNINRTSLSKNFKKITGKTISQYISEYRLKVAVNMLKFTRLSIEEISSSSGFSYSSYFIKLFTEKMSISPTEFRKKAYEKRGQKV